MPGSEIAEAIKRRSGFIEVYHVTTFRCTVQYDEVEVGEVWVEILDQGPEERTRVQRYSARVRNPDDTWSTSGTPSDSVEGALAAVHWDLVGRHTQR